jgi:hypothetical protein
VAVLVEGVPGVGQSPLLLLFVQDQQPSHPDRPQLLGDAVHAAIAGLHGPADIFFQVASIKQMIHRPEV